MDNEIKPTFKYRIVAETYRDKRRMSVGEEWVTMEPIHDSKALMPADEATEEAYLETYAKTVDKVPVRDSEGRIASFNEVVVWGQHVRHILNRRGIAKDDHEAYVDVYGTIADEKRAEAKAKSEAKAKEFKAKRDALMKEKRDKFLAEKSAADAAAKAAQGKPAAKA